MQDTAWKRSPRTAAPHHPSLSSPRPGRRPCQPTLRGQSTVSRPHLKSVWVYIAFALDVYSRMIVGWQLATHMQTGLPLMPWMAL